ncbi:MAG: KTSC domain-containing protein [Cytophagaceae bacterium]
MKKVSSSCISEMDYDRKKKRLILKYQPHGELYEYPHVSLKDYETLENAESKGEFVNRVIKKKYRFKKL